jgi:hypothetical protein
MINIDTYYREHDYMNEISQGKRVMLTLFGYRWVMTFAKTTFHDLEGARELISYDFNQSFFKL